MELGSSLTCHEPSSSASIPAPTSGPQMQIGRDSHLLLEGPANEPSRCSVVYALRVAASSLAAPRSRLIDRGRLGGRDTVGPASNSRPDVVNRPLFNCKP
jgi:hypothetical protein